TSCRTPRARSTAGAAARAVATIRAAAAPAAAAAADRAAPRADSRPMAKPRVAITAGDPAGIGPEIAARAAADPSVLRICDPVIYAPPDAASFPPGVL